VILQAHRFRIQFRGIFPDKLIRILHNAVDVKPFDDFQLNEKNGDGVLTILFVGHLSQAKGFIDLLKAAPKVLDTISEAVFVFAGEWLIEERNILFDETGHRLHFNSESAYSLWNNLRRSYGERLKHLGVLTGGTKIKTFLSAEVFVLPSYSEGFPMVVLEAMAARLPVVATPVGALPEVLLEGINAKFVMPGDIDALAGALVELSCHAEKRKQMGLANRKLVETVFTPYRMSNNLAEIFRECIK
jgi:glycosyltransferase involved in cell wall biosynthesis